MSKEQQIGKIFELSSNHPKRYDKSKDQRPLFNSAGVYKILCFCGQVYIGETGRMVNLQIKEHQRVRLKHAMQSALSEHNFETGH